MTRLATDFEETLRRYVLDTLEEDPRLQLEEVLVKDAGAFEALGVIEDELTEEYLDGTLTRVERLGFERHSLSSPHRRRVPGFFTALRARASVSAAEHAGASRSDPTSWFRPVLLQPAWVGAAAAVLVSALAANIWLTLRQSSLEGQVAQMQAELAEGTVPPLAAAAEEPPTSQLAELTATNQELEAQLEAERQQRLQAETLVTQLERAARRPRSSIPTFVLAAGLLRSEGSLTRVVVPPDVNVVRLALDLPGDEYPLYRATLYDVDGDEIWAQSKLKAEEAKEQIVVSLLIPTPLLPYGDYQMKVSGLTELGEPEALASYTFRAITQ